MPADLKKIGWIQISSRRGGGSLYAAEVRKVLSKEYDVELVNLESKYLKWRYFKPLEWAFNFLRLKGEKDLWVIHSFLDLALLSLSRIKGKKLALIYHIDISVFPRFLGPIPFLIEKLFYHNLKKVDAIVVIAEYWRQHFSDRGHPNIYKIYNSFDLAGFNINENEVPEFKKKYGLEGKPIVYIGVCQRAKGVVEIHQALKDLDVHLVASGRQEVEIPVLNLILEYQDYLKLLKAATIVMDMTKFKTGGSRIIQEAMLLKTPAIGSGFGAIRELVEGGGQIICSDFSSLKEKVEYLLDHPEVRKKMGEAGFNYARKFTLEKFTKSWLKLIKQLTICAE